MRTSSFVLVAATMGLIGLGCGKKEMPPEPPGPVKAAPAKTNKQATVKPAPPPEVKPPAPPVVKTNAMVNQPGALEELPPVKDISGEQTPEFAVKLNPVAVVEQTPPGAYESLFEELDLPEEKVSGLTDFLTARKVELAGLSAELANDSASREKMTEVSQRIKEQKAAFEKDIKALLGDEKFAVYQTYEASEPQRTQVDFLKPSLQDAPLSEEQERTLVQAMYEERKAFTFSHDYDGWIDLNPENYTDEAVARHLEEFDALQAKYLARARTILSAKQLKEFEADQASRKGTEHMRVLGMAQRYRRAVPPKALVPDSN